MVDTVAWNRCKVPNYWLDVEPTLAHDAIPHCYNGNVPDVIASNENPPDSGLYDPVPIDPEGGVPVDAGGTPTDAKAGTPGFFYPLGSNFADEAAITGSGMIPTDQPWDTQGQYIVIEDGTEWHYRLDQWIAGRVP